MSQSNNQFAAQISKSAVNSISLRQLDDRLAASIYLRSSWFNEWSILASEEVAIGLIARIKLWLFHKDKAQADRLIRKILKLRELVRSELNDQIVRETTEKYRDYFDTVEKNPLTAKQREACASDEDATLVVAGAGTGKTSTILAKIGLLLRTGQCTQDQILAISFTTKSANELAERVKELLGVELQVSTFHKLGLDTIALLNGGKPNLAPFASVSSPKR